MSEKKIEKRATVWKDKSGQSHSRVRILEDGKEVGSYTSTGDTAEAATKQAFAEMSQAEEDRPGIDQAPVSFERPPGAVDKSPKPIKPPEARDTDGDGIPDEIDRDPTDASSEIKIKSRNHKPWEGSFDGTAGALLKEEVPTYLKRPGDRVITAASDKAGGYDNNAAIILGRDRSGIGERWAPWRNIEDLNGEDYSDHQAAGAIDIVVGRMSPFPVKSFRLAGKDVPIRLSPIFRTKHNEGLTTSVDLVDNDMSVAHPGLGMDAARIYLSQMTEVDKNFGFTEMKRDFSLSAAAEPNIDKKVRALNDKYIIPEDEPGIPTSAIAAVADKVRLYARQDIKIMTGGIDYQGTDPEKLEQYNSQGNKIGAFNGIHLIAGNGSTETGPQQPIPKGNELVKAFGELVTMMDNLIGVVDGLAQAQMEYNGVLMNHFHQSPFQGLPTSPSLTSQVYGVKTMADHISRVKIGVVFLKTNIVRFKLNHLNVSGDGYICSRYNTTN